MLSLIGAWGQCLTRTVYARHLLDSEAARKAIAKGLSIALEHLRKSSIISLAALHDMFKGLGVERCESKENKSDISTKPMGQQTLTRHLFSLGYYTLEWIEVKKQQSSSNDIQRHNGNSGIIAASIQHHLEQSLI